VPRIAVIAGVLMNQRLAQERIGRVGVLLIIQLQDIIRSFDNVGCGRRPGRDVGRAISARDAALDDHIDRRPARIAGSAVKILRCTNSMHAAFGISADRFADKAGFFCKR